MAVKAKVIAVSTTPAAAIDASASMDSVRATIKNTGGTGVFIGGADLTAANSATNGWPLAAAGQIDNLELPAGDTLYVVTASGTSTLAVLYAGGS